MTKFGGRAHVQFLNGNARRKRHDNALEPNVMPYLRTLVLLAAGLIPDPASSADAMHGQELARRWCAECHVVAPDQRQASTQAPPFSAIARTPDFNANRLAFFLLDPHPKMPSMSLTRVEAADLAAYIASLK
jgi:mono/diheme cytochrome c family protein